MNVLSRELSEKLDKKGIKIETERYWYVTWSHDSKKRDNWILAILDEDDKVNRRVPAPTAEELVRELPDDGLEIKRIGYPTGVDGFNGSFQINNLIKPEKKYIAEALTEALGLMLLEVE